MFGFATACGTLFADYQRIAYIDNRETPGVYGVSPPGPWEYYSLISLDAHTNIPILLFFLNQILADGFLVSPVPRLVVQVSDVRRSSALPLLHYLLHEPLGHGLPMFTVPLLHGYVFKPLQVDSSSPY